MIEILLKSSIAIGAALIFYRLVLQQESFFATNRVYLISCLVLAFALPFISLPKVVNQQGFVAAVIEKGLSKEEAPKKAFSAPLENRVVMESSPVSTSEEKIAEIPVEITPGPAALQAGRANPLTC